MTLQALGRCQAVALSAASEGALDFMPSIATRIAIRRHASALMRRRGELPVARVDRGWPRDERAAHPRGRSPGEWRVDPRGAGKIIGKWVSCLPGAYPEKLHNNFTLALPETD
jgi:hypothetical protein